MSSGQPFIFISAAETSGDMHAAHLAQEIRRAWPESRLQALGGPVLAAAGCDLLEDLVQRSAMLASAISQIPFYFRLRNRIKESFRRQRPDLVITVDSFEWNLHVAKAAHQLGIPVLVYSAPQLWAWGSWRVGNVRKYIDQIASFLPFEPEWFGQRGVKANFVGHPLFDRPEAHQPTPSPAANRPFPKIALLPGSRKQEIARLWQPMQVIASQIQRQYPQAIFQSVASNAENAQTLWEQADPHLGIEIRQTALENIVREADLALIASGTATLQTAGQGCPMIVLYHINPWQWHLIGRWLIRTPYLCLVNILAGRELVPEFMPFHRDTAAVTKTAIELLADEQQRSQMRRELLQLVEPLKQGGAAANTVELIKGLLEAHTGTLPKPTQGCLPNKNLGS